MATVNVQPMPQSYRNISTRFRPGAPPIFPDGKYTAEDLELARELFKALDPESQEWYRRGGGRSLFEGL
jgi:hypothetical protein